jgi:biopolymer transport protein ExbD
MGNKAGLILRLIDVVFNLLFAFIAISQISVAAQIEPPKSTEAPKLKDDSLNVLIVGVLKDGQFDIGNGKLVLTDSTSLDRYLSQWVRQNREGDKPLGVRIRADKESAVEHSLVVANICRSLGVAKGIDVMRVRMK